MSSPAVSAIGSELRERSGRAGFSSAGFFCIKTGFSSKPSVAGELLMALYNYEFTPHNKSFQKCNGSSNPQERSARVLRSPNTLPGSLSMIPSDATESKGSRLSFSTRIFPRAAHSLGMTNEPGYLN